MCVWAKGGFACIVINHYYYMTIGNTSKCNDYIVKLTIVIIISNCLLLIHVVSIDYTYYSNHYLLQYLLIINIVINHL